jgi:hypothetical protein
MFFCWFPRLTAEVTYYTASPVPTNANPKNLEFNGSKRVAFPVPTNKSPVFAYLRRQIMPTMQSLPTQKQADLRK